MSINKRKSNYNKRVNNNNNKNYHKDETIQQKYDRIIDNEEGIKPYFKNKDINQLYPELRLDSYVYVNRYINQNLRDYQREGVKFLYKNYRQNNGCVLADDMGLGKTIQVISFLSALFNKCGKEEDLLRLKPECVKKDADLKDLDRQTIPPFLIASPGAVLYNWLNEFNVWSYFSIGIYHLEKRKDTLNDLRKNKLEIVLTTHETCRDHIDELVGIKWSGIIVDEFHKLKGLKAQLAAAFKRFDVKFRVGLSGTILQNNLIELWALLDWANPDCLGDCASFKKEYVKPIMDGQNSNATKGQLAEKVRIENALRDLKDQWVLRRTKSLIADQLPNKIEQVVHCHLSDFQIELYKKALEMLEIEKNSERKDKGFLLVYISLFLKIANNAALVLPENSPNDRSGRSMLLLTHFYPNIEEILKDKTKYEKIKSDFYNVYNCGKMMVLESMLKVFKKEKSKVLLFSRSVKLLDMIEKDIICEGYTYVRIDGKVKNTDRIDLVNRFNKDDKLFLFLISTTAGGIGLNIVGANVVVLFDPNFNPSHDLQALDRAYRIGQSRDVRMYRLISSGCIEENIYLRQLYKILLNKECVENEDAKRLFNDDEIFGAENIFKLNVEECETKSIFKRTAVTEREIAGLAGLDLKITKYMSLDVEDEDLDDENDDENDDESDVECKENINEEYCETYDNIEEVLGKSNIVYVQKNISLKSKIEKHTRECAVKDKSNLGVLASNAALMIKPQLNTLDIIEIEQNECVQLEDFVGSRVKAIYGATPVEVREEQFIEMANLLKIKPFQLANEIIKMEKEERYAYLKKFYLNNYPETKEFYDNFSKYSNKLKRENSTSFETNKNKKKSSDMTGSTSNDKIIKNINNNESRYDNLLDELHKK